MPSIEDGGSNVWSGGFGEGCPHPCGLWSDIELYLRYLKRCFDFKIGPGACESARLFFSVS